jgi:hypothetical protein
LERDEVTVTVEDMWQQEAEAFAEGQYGTDWTFNGANVVPDSTRSVAEYVSKRTGAIHKVALIRDTFFTPESRTAEIRRQLTEAE